jgi:NTE family protein
VRTINVALQGGGAHGAVTWGVLDRLLEEERIAIESISGTSAGAVNAVALGYGLRRGGPAAARETLDELWRSISHIGALYSPVRRLPWTGAGVGNSDLAYRYFDIVTRTFSPYQFNPFDFNPLRAVLERCIDFEDLRRCRRHKTFLSATNVRTGKIRVFETKELSVETVLASACLPFLFQAVEIDGEAYWDGGYLGNPALFPFFYESASQDIVLVHVNPLTRDETPKSAPEIMNRLNEISFNSSLLAELRAIGFVQKLIEQGWLKDEYADRLKNIRMHSIRSDAALGDLSVASKFDVDFAFLSDLKERGRRIAGEWIEANYAKIGGASSVDVRSLYDGAPRPR